MKLLLTAIFMCVYITFVQVIKAHRAIVIEGLNAYCGVWIEDTNHKRIAGDEKGHYHDCSEWDTSIQDIKFLDQEYYVVAKFEASHKKNKVQGPFNRDACFNLDGSVDSWSFEEC